MLSADQMIKFERDVTALFYTALKIVRDYAPRDTGNLADKALRAEWRTDRRTSWGRKFVIYVDTSGSIRRRTPGKAPYMPYTNEPWIAEYWRGRKNPNEGWWQDAAEFIAKYINKHIKGIKI